MFECVECTSFVVALAWRMCGKDPGDTPETTGGPDTSVELVVPPSPERDWPAFKSGDSTVKNAVAKEDCIGPFVGKGVTVNGPVYTGIPTEATYTYKEYFPCLDGVIAFQVVFAPDNQSKTIYLDKTAAIIENPNRTVTVKDYLSLNEDKPYRIELSGEPGDYHCQLFNETGEAISEIYDNIGAFYNGIALIEQDYETGPNKIGLITDTGEVLLEPCIPVDTVAYVYYPVETPTGTIMKEKEFLNEYMFEDAFVLSIGGELAIFTVTRGT